MGITDNPQLDPRALKATSVKAEDPATPGPGPSTLKITAASSDPKMFTLPWEKPLATWPPELLVNLPRGISRHIVRFVHVGDEVYAMKEITRTVAEREYELLRQLQKLNLPTVQPIAVVTGRHDDNGEPLEAILVTKHLRFSMPYRALFARTLRPDTAERLIDALAVLMVRLHLAGFYWGDVSLSNVLFLKDADAFSAFLVDAETGDLQIELTAGQREYDIDLARTNIIGELMDLSSGELLPPDVDEISIGNRLVDRYHSLWSALTDTDNFSPNEMWKIEKRVNRLNELGFDVDELEMKTAEDGKRVLVRPRVVDAGYANRRLLRLTGHEVLDHRWYMAEKAGHDVPMAEAVQSYIKNVLPQYQLDTKTVNELNADADAGVVDDEYTYDDASNNGAHTAPAAGHDDGYNPEDDPDAAVWAH